MEELEDSKKKTDAENLELKQRLSEMEARMKIQAQEVRELREALSKALTGGVVNMPPSPPLASYDDNLYGTFSDNTILTPNTPLTFDIPSSPPHSETLSQSSGSPSVFSPASSFGLTQHPAVMLCLGPQCQPARNGSSLSAAWTTVLSLILSWWVSILSALTITKSPVMTVLSSLLFSTWIKPVSTTSLRSAKLSRSLPLETRSNNATGRDMRELSGRREMVVHSNDSGMDGRSGGKPDIMAMSDHSSRRQSKVDVVERRGAADSAQLLSCMGFVGHWLVGDYRCF